MLFIKTKTAKAKKLAPTADVSSIESILFNKIGEETDVYSAVHGIFRFEVMNPWGDVITIIKNDLTSKGILNRVEKGKVLMITTHKHVLAGEMPKEEAKKLQQLQKISQEIQQKEELYKKVASEVAKALEARQEKPDTN